MTAELLYYPFMQPREAWLRAAILFCDRVFTIVPKSRHGLNWLSGETQEIVEHLEASAPSLPAGCDSPSRTIAQIDPHADVYAAFGQTLTREVQRYYETNENAKWFRDAATVDEYVSLAGEKLPKDLDRWLKSTGLSLMAGEDPDNQRTHPNIANFIMNQLASHISGRLNVPSATDQIQDFACNALRGLDKPDAEGGDVLLFGWSVPVMVPGEVIHLDAASYLEVRKRYQDIAIDVSAMLRDVVEHYRIDRVETWQELSQRLDQARHWIEQKVKKYIEDHARFRASQAQRMLLGGVVEASKMIPVAGGLVGVGERLFVESRRRPDIPATAAQAVFANLADLHQEVTDLLVPPATPARRLIWSSQRGSAGPASLRQMTHKLRG